MPAGCTRAGFSFAPNRVLTAADLVSLAACLGLLVLLAVRRPRRTETLHADLADAGAPRLPPARALALGLAAALAIGFVFALRAGAVLGPLVALALWRGVGARALALGAGTLLAVVVPVAHLAAGLPGAGYDTNYAVAHIAAHWAGVAAVCALALALVLTLRGQARGRRSPPAP